MTSVLIIDSDNEVADVLSATLQEKGVTTTITGDGTEGLNIAKSEVPDVVVLCVELNRVSGYSICNKLKKDPALAKIPLILTSSQATEETFEQHKKLKTRAEQYLKKPYETSEILGLIGQYIDIAHDEAADVEVSLDDMDVDVETDAAGSAAAPDPKESVSTAAVTGPVSVPDDVSDDDDEFDRPTASEDISAIQGELVSESKRRDTSNIVADAQSERLRAEVQTLRKKVQKLEHTLQEKDLEHNDRLLQESTRSREAVELKKKLGLVEREISKHQQAAEKATQESLEAKAAMNSAQKEAKEAETERQALSDKIGELVDKVKTLAAERNELKEQVASLEQAAKDVEGELATAAQVRQKAKKAVDIAVQLLQETGLMH